MADDYGLSDLRFEGYSNHELATQIEGLRTGTGASGLHRAAAALMDVAKGLSYTDTALRIELHKIGVEWQGQAADGGTEATEQATIYAEDAVAPTAASSGGMDNQGETFSHTTHSAPDPGTLRGPTVLDGADRFAEVFGYTTDHAREVQATSAARDQAVAGLTSYQSGSLDALNQYRPLPVPPGMDLVAQPTEGPSQTGTVGRPTVGGGPGAPGGLTGVPGPLGTPGPPGDAGKFSSVGPVGPPASGAFKGPVPAHPGLIRVPPLLVADAAALATAGAAGSALGDIAEKDRLTRGRGGAGGTAGKSGLPVASVPDDEARAARNAEKFGARPGRAVGGSIMQPAATSGGIRGEDDREHVRKYGIDSGDVFEDGRLTAPASIGADQDDRRAT